MIDECIGYGLPEPLFEDSGTNFIVTFRKSKLTDEFLKDMNLNKRQRRALEYLKDKGRITNREYVDINGVYRNTATKDLMKLVANKIIKQVGSGRVQQPCFYPFSRI